MPKADMKTKNSQRRAAQKTKTQNWAPRKTPSPCLLLCALYHSCSASVYTLSLDRREDSPSVTSRLSNRASIVQWKDWPNVFMIAGLLALLHVFVIAPPHTLLFLCCEKGISQDHCDICDRANELHWSRQAPRASSRSLDNQIHLQCLLWATPHSWTSTKFKGPHATYQVHRVINLHTKLPTMNIAKNRKASLTLLEIPRRQLVYILHRARDHNGKKKDGLLLEL